jgi:hypothetical protein
VDLKELGAYIQTLSAAGMPLFPNADLEKHLLELAGLPTGGVMEVPDDAQIAIEAPNVMGENTLTVPALPAQTPTLGGINDRTPIDQKPPVVSPVTNAQGDTERTARMVPAQ